MENSPAYANIIRVLFIVILVSLPLKNSIYQVSYGLFSILFLWILFRLRDFYFIKNHILITSLFLLILISMSVSNTIGIGNIESFDLVFKFFYRYILFYFSLLYFMEQKVLTFKFISIVLMSSFSIQVFDGVYQYHTGFDLFVHSTMDSNGRRLTGSMFSSNIYGYIIAINIAFLTYYAVKNLLEDNSHLKNLLFTILIVASLFSLLYSASRSSWIMFFVFTAAYISYNYKMVDKYVYCLIILLVIALTACIYTDDSLLHRFNQLVTGYSSYRWDIWEFSWENILKAPLFGYGLNGYSNLNGPLVGMPHNIIAEVLLFTGVSGFLLFSALFSTAIKSTQSIIKKDRLLGSFMLFLFLSILIGYLFDHSITDGKVATTILFVIMAMITYLSSSKRDQKC